MDTTFPLNVRNNLQTFGFNFQKGNTISQIIKLKILFLNIITLQYSNKKKRIKIKLTKLII